MGQIALPLEVPGDGGRIVVGAGLQPLFDRLAVPLQWPFKTAILAGPPRSGKSLIARWFAASGLGEAIDDADFMDETALFHAWNRAQEAGRPLLLARAGEGQWQIALPDLASRLNAAQVLEIPPPDDEQVEGLLAAHAARRALPLGEGVTTWLAPRIERSHAGIEALVGTIDRLSLERKAPVTISLVRDALEEQGGAYHQPRLL